MEFRKEGKRTGRGGGGNGGRLKRIDGGGRRGRGGGRFRG